MNSSASTITASDLALFSVATIVIGGMVWRGVKEMRAYYTKLRMLDELEALSSDEGNEIKHDRAHIAKPIDVMGVKSSGLSGRRA